MGEPHKVARRRRRLIEEEPTPAVNEDDGDDVDRIIQTYKDKITNPVSGIRAHCVECMGGQPRAVADCPSNGKKGHWSCALWPFRMGKNTMHKKAKG